MDLWLPPDGWPITYPEETLREVHRIRQFAEMFQITIERWQVPLLAEMHHPDRRQVTSLLPKGNGKTGLLAVDGLWAMLKPREQEAYIGAATREQSSILWRKVKGYALRNTAISRHLDIQHNQIKQRKSGGFMKPLSGDAPRAHGIGPTWAAVDELWAHRNPEVYENFRASREKQDGRITVISTAGDDPNGALANLRSDSLAFPNQYREGHLTFTWSEGARQSYFEWGLQPDEDWQDPALVKQVNPLSIITERYLTEQLGTAGFRESAFKQFHCNLWVDSTDSWLPDSAWADLRDPDATIPDGAPVVLGLDCAYSQNTKDCTALVRLWQRPDGKIVVEADIWTPPTDGTQFELGIAEDKIREYRDRYSVVACAYDPSFFISNAQTLSAEGLTMIPISQGSERMPEAGAALYEAITTQRRIVHNASPEFSSHVQAASYREAPGGIRIVKGKNKRPIDACVAMAIGLSQIHLTEQTSYEKHGLRGFDLTGDGVWGM